MSTRTNKSQTRRKRRRKGNTPYKYYLDKEEILKRGERSVTDWNEELLEALKTDAVIRKDGPDSKPFCIYSKTGKKLGCYSSRKQAEDRLKQIEQFKHMKKDK